MFCVLDVLGFRRFRFGHILDVLGLDVLVLDVLGEHGTFHQIHYKYSPVEPFPIYYCYIKITSQCTAKKSSYIIVTSQNINISHI
jgi:hypothetical protein